MAFISGKNFIIDIFGESHSRAIGVVINGIPPGTPLDGAEIDAFLARRKPSNAVHSTARKERDRAVVLSGLLDGRATGAPLCIIIENADTRSSDYEKLRTNFRPSHSDYAAYVKYCGHNDYRGGGQFSGRLTAALCAAGSVALSILSARGIEITAYLASVGGVRAVSYLDGAEGLTSEKIREIKSAVYPLLDKSYEKAIIEEISAAAREGDSVGGVVECVVTGLPAGVGEPIYDGLEGSIAKMIFAIPAVKGIEFGRGFGVSEMRGSAANDAIYYEENSCENPTERGGLDGKKANEIRGIDPLKFGCLDGVKKQEKCGGLDDIKNRIKTRTNNNGGITGGISNGMPILFRTAIKPVPSISKEQDTVDIESRKNTKLTIHGRHDSCIAPRAVPVVEAAAACVLLDFLL
jgi:chorismate synthase